MSDIRRPLVDALEALGSACSAINRGESVAALTDGARCGPLLETATKVSREATTLAEKATRLLEAAEAANSAALKARAAFEAAEAQVAAVQAEAKNEADRAAAAEVKAKEEAEKAAEAAASALQAKSKATSAAEEAKLAEAKLAALGGGATAENMYVCEETMRVYQNATTVPPHALQYKTAATFIFHMSASPLSLHLFRLLGDSKLPAATMPRRSKV